MRIQNQNEKEWLKCHALVYLNTNERRLEGNKPTYSGKSIEFVAFVDGKIVGFLEIELGEAPGTISYRKFEGSGVLWDIEVLPEFRGRSIATSLLNEGVERDKKLGMKRLEAWNVESQAWIFTKNTDFKNSMNIIMFL